MVCMIFILCFSLSTLKQYAATLLDSTFLFKKKTYQTFLGKTMKPSSEYYKQ